MWRCGDGKLLNDDDSHAKGKPTLHLHLHSTNGDANTTKKIDERDQYDRYPQASKMPSTPRINHHAPPLIIATHCNCEEREKEKKRRERKKEREREREEGKTFRSILSIPGINSHAKAPPESQFGSHPKASHLIKASFPFVPALPKRNVA
ncbi:hypothetical protein EYC84_000997 [Monilinia fructicola]|uniref:Uncharacterized protein n=1 Tax=Monilinia fructicola TaxID=38448 RepID=A0A5M9JQY3_MONFR|nr:hypothetical protein EYC84_000997 [Monilinia fructicola]